MISFIIISVSVTRCDLIDKMPPAVGVYLMRDSRGKTIYVGKAKNLRQRVRSYFTPSGGDQRPQIPFLLREVRDIDFIVTETEREALILENALIKQHKPRYNVLLKDDKNYTLLRLGVKERFPKLTYTRRMGNDGALYFGPFSSAAAMRQTKRLIHRMFPLRDCTDAKFRRHASRPCLHYYVKLCSAPCAGKITEEEYAELVRRASLFLNGRINEILKELRRRMEDTARDLRFEEAARLRDLIRLIETNRDVKRQLAASLEDRDVIGFHREGDDVEIGVLFVRNGAVVDKAGYLFRNVHGDDADVLAEFLMQFYGANRFVPKEVVVPIEMEGADLVAGVLSERSGRKVAIVHPKRGGKARLVQLAQRNALESYRMRAGAEADGEAALRDLGRALGLAAPPRSIECFDVSNIQGTSAVASMVRFEDGRPVKSRYKRFRIKGVEGPDDYAMMYEVLARRLKRSGEEGWELPDLLVVDGGKGQLNVALEALHHVGAEDAVTVAALAKARGDEEADKVYVAGAKGPVTLETGSKGLLLLMRIRDEAHRFAVTYHKRLRGKRALTSRLDAVPGIGAKRKRALLMRYADLESMAQASVEELASVPGMNRKAAAELKRHLEKNP